MAHSCAHASSSDIYYEFVSIGTRRRSRACRSARAARAAHRMMYQDFRGPPATVLILITKLPGIYSTYTAYCT